MASGAFTAQGPQARPSDFLFQSSHVRLPRRLVYCDFVAQLLHLHLEKLKAGELRLAIVAQVFGVVVDTVYGEFGHGVLRLVKQR